MEGFESDRQYNVPVTAAVWELNLQMVILV